MGVRKLNVSDELPALPGRSVVCMLYSGARGEAPSVNQIVAASPAADVVLLREGAKTGRRWLERMRAAAHCDTTVVTASALSNGRGLLAVPFTTTAPALGEDITEVTARAVAEASKRLYPRVPCPAGPCVYLRREALELLGGLDEQAPDVITALGAFGQRALARGMLHVVADDVYVAAPGDTGEVASTADGPGESSAAAAAIAADPPADPLASDRSKGHGALLRCLDIAQMARDGLSVTIDARTLGPVLTGTQVYTIELVLALARRKDIALRVIVPPDLSPEAADAFAVSPAIELVPYAEAARGGLALSHIVHRPQQVFSEHDLALLRLLGKRIVIGQQDLIAYRNPTYHADPETWQSYRHATRLALAVADCAVFFSGHAQLDAVREDLIDEARTVVAGIGGEELWARRARAPARPAGMADESSGPFLLCLGADYGHKNRPFAISLLAALHASGGWQGRLVFAGGHVSYGSSAEQERAALAAHPEVADSVVDLGSVSEAGRSWLMEHARAVVYPSLYEGFGLLPFEAARVGIPCLYAPQASLGEGTLANAATLCPWNAHESARAAVELLVDGPPRERHIALLRDAAAGRSWAGVAEDLRTVYERVLVSPHRASAVLHWQEYECYIVELERHLRRLRDSVGVLAQPSQGGLLSEAQGRGLVRIASRPLSRRLLLGPVGLLGRR